MRSQFVCARMCYLFKNIHVIKIARESFCNHCVLPTKLLPPLIFSRKWVKVKWNINSMPTPWPLWISLHACVNRSPDYRACPPPSLSPFSGTIASSILSSSPRTCCRTSSHTSFSLNILLFLPCSFRQHVSVGVCSERFLSVPPPSLNELRRGGGRPLFCRGWMERWDVYRLSRLDQITTSVRLIKFINCICRANVLPCRTPPPERAQEKGTCLAR